MNLIKPDQSWDKLFVRYISPKIDDYAIAKKLEIDASICDDSDLETLISAKVGEKRYRVAAKKRYPNEPLGDSSDLDEGQEIEEPPLLSKKPKVDAQSKMPQPSASGLERKSKGAPGHQCPPDGGNTSALENNIANGVESIWPKEKSNDDVLSKILNELQEIRATLNVDVADIKEQLAALSTTVQTILESPEGPIETLDMTLFERFQFPLKDTESLLLLEEELNTNQDFKLCVVEYLLNRAALPKKDISDKERKYFINRAVNGMCSAIMSDELATQFSMKGRSEERQSFEEFFPVIIFVVLDAMQKKYKIIKNLPIDLITEKRSMGEWFRLSKNRTEEGKTKRRLKKINQGNGI